MKAQTPRGTYCGHGLWWENKGSIFILSCLSDAPVMLGLPSTALGTSHPFVQHLFAWSCPHCRSHQLKTAQQQDTTVEAIALIALMTRLDTVSQWLPALEPVPKKARMKTPTRMTATEATKIRMLIQPGICTAHMCQKYISLLP